MDAYDVLARKFVGEVVDGVMAEIQRFSDALEAWLGEFWDAMPRDGWREDLDHFLADWAAAGAVVEPDDVRDLKAWIAEFERQAIARRQALVIAAQQHSDAVVIPRKNSQDSADSPLPSGLPIAVGKSAATLRDAATAMVGDVLLAQAAVGAVPTAPSDRDGEDLAELKRQAALSGPKVFGSFSVTNGVVSTAPVPVTVGLLPSRGVFGATYSGKPSIALVPASAPADGAAAQYIRVQTLALPVLRIEINNDVLGMRPPRADMFDTYKHEKDHAKAYSNILHVVYDRLSKYNAFFQAHYAASAADDDAKAADAYTRALVSAELLNRQLSGWLAQRMALEDANQTLHLGFALDTDKTVAGGVVVRKGTYGRRIERQILEAQVPANLHGNRQLIDISNALEVLWHAKSFDQAVHNYSEQSKLLDKKLKSIFTSLESRIFSNKKPIIILPDDLRRLK